MDAKTPDDASQTKGLRGNIEIGMIPPRDCTEVYVDANYFICIRQNCFMADDNQIVMLNADDAEMVIEFLRQGITKVGELLDGDDGA